MNFTDEVTPKSESKDLDQSSDEEEPAEYSMQSDDSTDKVPVRESSNTTGYRQKINKPIKDEDEIHDKLAEKMPGVMNMRSLMEQQEELKRQKESKAALVIQKRLRGHWGRKAAKKKLMKHKNMIEYEYNALNRELKSN